MKKATVINGISLCEAQLDVLGMWFKGSEHETELNGRIDSLEDTKNVLIELMCLADNEEYDDKIKKSLGELLFLIAEMKELLPERGGES